MIIKKLFWVLGILLLVLGCSSDNSDDDTGSPNLPNDPAFLRADLLTNWADNIIIPAYQSFSTALSELEVAFNAFNSTTDETNLLAFRQAWQDAYFVWQRVSLFENGPAESVNFRNNINIFPTAPAEIEQNIISDFDLSLPSNIDAKGFPALDYIINGSAASDAAIVARFNDPTEGALFFNYTEAIIADMINLTATVLGEWTTSFRDVFVENDGSSINASVDRIVNDYIFYYEFPLRRGKVALASGAFGNVPSEDLLEGFYIGNISNQLCLEALESAQDFFNGVSFNGSVNGIGLDDYLDALDARDADNVSLTSIINNQYDLTQTTIANLAPFQEELQSNPPTNLLLAVEELNRIIPLIKTDMLSFLNINVDFQDNDGD